MSEGRGGRKEGKALFIETALGGREENEGGRRKGKKTSRFPWDKEKEKKVTFTFLLVRPAGQQAGREGGGLFLAVKELLP